MALDVFFMVMTAGLVESGGLYGNGIGRAEADMGTDTRIIS